MKVTGGISTIYAYDASGEVAAEYSTNPPTQTGTLYQINDPLGSTRLVLNSSGNPVGYHDYLPFGEEIPAGMGARGSLYADTDGVTHKFTGKERDVELAGSAMQGLDYFGYRYFSSAQGRWTSPDEPFADQHPEDPQTWNLYEYGRNNPLRYTDPDGKGIWDKVVGVAKAVGNVGVGINNTVNHATNWVISPYTSYRFADAPAFEATNADQNDGMQNAQDMMMALPAMHFPAVSGEAAAAEEVPQITQNAAKGAAFQNDVAAGTALTDTNVVQNIMVKTQSGVRTQIDVVSTNQSGNIVLQEAKSSATAPFTPNQTAAHPEIAQTGATVVGKGKPPYVGGTKIPPTTVKVVRPNCSGGSGCQQ